MATKRPSKSKPGGKSSSSSSSSKSKSNSSSRPKSSSSAPSSSKRSSGPRPAAKQLKTRPGVHSAPILGKKPGGVSKNRHATRRTYTSAELKVPAVNSIIPYSAAPARKGSGKKKNKVFVDDEEGMRTIMAIVNAEREGEIESRMVKMRRMEEIREARRVEGEKRGEERKEKMEGIKRGLKKNKKGKGMEVLEKGGDEKASKKKKKVSFAGV